MLSLPKSVMFGKSVANQLRRKTWQRHIHSTAVADISAVAAFQEAFLEVNLKRLIGNNHVSKSKSVYCSTPSWREGNMKENTHESYKWVRRKHPGSFVCTAVQSTTVHYCTPSSIHQNYLQFLKCKFPPPYVHLIHYYFPFSKKYLCLPIRIIDTSFYNSI